MESRGLGKDMFYRLENLGWHFGTFPSYILTMSHRALLNN